MKHRWCFEDAEPNQMGWLCIFTFGRWRAMHARDDSFFNFMAAIYLRCGSFVKAAFSSWVLR